MARVKGLDDVLSNFQGVIDRTNDNARTGLQIGGAYLKGEALKLTPIDEGDLRASIYYSTVQDRQGADLRVGYTAKHAPYVHEAPMKLKGQPRTSGSKKGTYWSAGENKFLEKAVMRNAQRFLGIVARYMKL